SSFPARRSSDLCVLAAAGKSEMVGGGKSCIYVEYDGCPTEIKRLRKVLVRSSYPQICFSLPAESPSGDTSAPYSVQQNRAATLPGVLAGNDRDHGHCWHSAPGCL